ncbi:MAG: hypothetical protein ACK4WH_00855 [Phycisphaerales bacterium]
MKTHLDLRRSLRLTVADGRTILDALDAAGAPAKHLRAKLLAAIQRATHRCNIDARGRCTICDEDPMANARISKRRADTFLRSLERSARAREKCLREARERAAFQAPPPLRLAGDQS